LLAEFGDFIRGRYSLIQVLDLIKDLVHYVSIYLLCLEVRLEGFGDGLVAPLDSIVLELQLKVILTECTLNRVWSLLVLLTVLKSLTN